MPRKEFYNMTIMAIVVSALVLLAVASWASILWLCRQVGETENE